MKLEWIGHSCFRMTANDGTVVVTDPYDAKTGYEMIPLRADLVTKATSTATTIARRCSSARRRSCTGIRARRWAA